MIDQETRDEIAKQLADLIRSISQTPEPLDTSSGEALSIAIRYEAENFVNTLIDAIEDAK